MVSKYTVAFAFESHFDLKQTCDEGIYIFCIFDFLKIELCECGLIRLDKLLIHTTSERAKYGRKKWVDYLKDTEFDGAEQSIIKMNANINTEKMVQSNQFGIGLFINAHVSRAKCRTCEQSGKQAACTIFKLIAT